MVGIEFFHVDGRTDILAYRQTDRQTDRRDIANSLLSQLC
jgi:hypothetical protein